VPLSNAPNSENHAVNTPLSEQKPAKFEKSRLKAQLSKVNTPTDPEKGKRLSSVSVPAHL
jgi:hypothetical protein